MKSRLLWRIYSPESGKERRKRPPDFRRNGHHRLFVGTLPAVVSFVLNPSRLRERERERRWLEKKKKKQQQQNPRLYFLLLFLLMIFSFYKMTYASLNNSNNSRRVPSLKISKIPSVSFLSNPYIICPYTTSRPVRVIRLTLYKKSSEFLYPPILVHQMSDRICLILSGPYIRCNKRGHRW